MTRAGAAEDASRAEDDVPARLDFLLPPEVVSRLRRTPAFRGLGLRGGRRSRLAEIWAKGEEGETLGVAPGPGAGGIARVFGGVLGRRRRLISRTVPGLGLEITEGAFIAGTRGGRFCALSLDGPALLVAEAAHALAGELPLFATPAKLPALGDHLAGADRPHPREGPALDPGMDVALAARQILATRAGAVEAEIAALKAALWRDGPEAGDDPEPVHQTRVALRRLRAAMAAFAPLSAPGLDKIRGHLSGFGHILTPAREWDVFLAGMARDLRQSFPADAVLTPFLGEAKKRRDDAYAALRAWFAGDGARQFSVALASLPLLVMSTPVGPPCPLDDFARVRLEKRARRLRRVTMLAALDMDQLHRLRLDAKRLRYLGEMFAPCFPRRRTERFLRHLARLQDWLGAVNDAATTSRLVRGIAPEGSAAASGAAIVLAQGMALGVAAASVPHAIAKAEKTLQRLQALKPFWE